MGEGLRTNDEETTSRGVHRTFARAACVVCCFGFRRVFLVGRVMADVRVVGRGFFFLSVTGLVGALVRTTSAAWRGDESPFF